MIRRRDFITLLGAAAAWPLAARAQDAGNSIVSERCSEGSPTFAKIANRRRTRKDRRRETCPPTPTGHSGIAVTLIIRPATRPVRRIA